MDFFLTWKGGSFLENSVRLNQYLNVDFIEMLFFSNTF